jgi:hypothetical protein
MDAYNKLRDPLRNTLYAGLTGCTAFAIAFPTANYAHQKVGYPLDPATAADSFRTTLQEVFLQHNPQMYI